MRWWFPLFLFTLFAPFSAEMDLAVSRYFYVEGHFSSYPLFLFMYHYGYLIGNIVACAAAVVLVGSYLVKRWKKWRSPALLLVLTMLVGAVVISHAIFKDNWGRPRPKQVEEFGGLQQFRPFYEPNFSSPEPSKSFPCGHCTTGFFFFALALIGKRMGNTNLTAVGFVLAVVLGGLLSLTRIAQGGHFLSDTLASALIMWYTALLCDWLIYSEKLP
ncbi:MAG: phosphatase PAP2 family protein [Parachlamydiaceae bacterium]|nr:phosphatase PAP2 family protein [Parachlamydiaceae bacterium]